MLTVIPRFGKHCILKMATAMSAETFAINIRRDFLQKPNLPQAELESCIRVCQELGKKIARFLFMHLNAHTEIYEYQ
jgi:hypothetical protein